MQESLPCKKSEVPVTKSKKVSFPGVSPYSSSSEVHKKVTRSKKIVKINVRRLNEKSPIQKCKNGNIEVRKTSKSRCSNVTGNEIGRKKRQTRSSCTNSRRTVRKKKQYYTCKSKSLERKSFLTVTNAVSDPLKTSSSTAPDYIVAPISVSGDTEVNRSPARSFKPVKATNKRARTKKRKRHFATLKLKIPAPILMRKQLKKLPKNNSLLTTPTLKSTKLSKEDKVNESLLRREWTIRGEIKYKRNTDEPTGDTAEHNLKFRLHNNSAESRIHEERKEPTIERNDPLQNLNSKRNTSNTNIGVIKSSIAADVTSAQRRSKNTLIPETYISNKNRKLIKTKRTKTSVENNSIKTPKHKDSIKKEKNKISDNEKVSNDQSNDGKYDQIRKEPSTSTLKRIRKDLDGKRKSEMGSNSKTNKHNLTSLHEVSNVKDASTFKRNTESDDKMLLLPEEENALLRRGSNKKKHLKMKPKTREGTIFEDSKAEQKDDVIRKNEDETNNGAIIERKSHSASVTADLTEIAKIPRLSKSPEVSILELEPKLSISMNEKKESLRMSLADEKIKKSVSTDFHKLSKTKNEQSEDIHVDELRPKLSIDDEIPRAKPRSTSISGEAEERKITQLSNERRSQADEDFPLSAITMDDYHEGYQMRRPTKKMAEMFKVKRGTLEKQSSSRRRSRKRLKSKGVASLSQEMTGEERNELIFERTEDELEFPLDSEFKKEHDEDITNENIWQISREEQINSSVDQEVNAAEVEPVNEDMHSTTLMSNGDEWGNKISSKKLLEITVTQDEAEPEERERINEEDKTLKSSHYHVSSDKPGTIRPKVQIVKRTVRKSHTSHKLQQKPDTPIKNKKSLSSRKSSGKSSVRRGGRKTLKGKLDKTRKTKIEPVNPSVEKLNESLEVVGEENKVYHDEIAGEQWMFSKNDTLYPSLYGEMDEMITINPPGTPNISDAPRQDNLEYFGEQQIEEMTEIPSAEEEISLSKDSIEYLGEDTSTLELLSSSMINELQKLTILSEDGEELLEQRWKPAEPVPSPEQVDELFESDFASRSEQHEREETWIESEVLGELTGPKTSGKTIKPIPPTRSHSGTSMGELGSLLEIDHDLLSRHCPELDLSEKGLLHIEERRASASSIDSKGEEDRQVVVPLSSEEEDQVQDASDVLDAVVKNEQDVDELSDEGFHDEFEIDEQIILELMDKVVALQKKVNWCNVCKKPYTAQCANHPSTPSSLSFTDSFILDDYLKKKEVSQIEKQLSTHESDLAIAREMTVLNKKVHVLCDQIGSLSDKFDKEETNSQSINEEEVDQQKHMNHKRKMGWLDIKKQLEKVLTLLEKKREKKEIDNFVTVTGEDGEIYYERKPSIHSYMYRDVAGEGGKRLNIFDYLDYLDTYSKKPLGKEEAKRIRLQQYLLGLTKHWSRDDQSASTYNQHRSEWSDYFDEADGSDNEDQFDDSDKSKNSQKERPVTSDNLPFSCKCFCDRISRLNPKNREHFRPTLNENLWCFRLDNNRRLENDETNPDKNEAIKGEMLVKMKSETSCTQEETEEKFRTDGWLEDADRNLLLLINRDPLVRHDPGFYSMKHLAPISDDDNDMANKDKLVNDLLNKISKAESERFWKAVESWYADYRKSDKIRHLLECLEEIDLNSMLRRDLRLIKEQLDNELMSAKEQIRLKVENSYKRKFATMVGNLETAYKVDLKNFLDAKEAEEKLSIGFTVRSRLLEAKEKLASFKMEYKQVCLRWMEGIKDRYNSTSRAATTSKASKLASIVDKIDVAERIRRKLVTTSARDHEQVEEDLVNSVDNRKIVIEELQRRVVNLARDVNIWKMASSELLKSLKNFVSFMRCRRPERAAQVLNLERLYQITMDGIIKESNASEDSAEQSELIQDSGTESFPLQLAMEIKCPSHNIRFPSDLTKKTGSSSDTDLEADVRAEKVGKHVVDWMIRATLPTPNPSKEIMEDEKEGMEFDDLISLFAGQHGQEIQHSEDESAKDNVVEEREPSEVTNTEFNISVDEFTKRRIKDMIDIIARAKPFFKSQIRM